MTFVAHELLAAALFDTVERSFDGNFVGRSSELMDRVQRLWAGPWDYENEEAAFQLIKQFGGFNKSSQQETSHYLRINCSSTKDGFYRTPPGLKQKVSERYPLLDEYFQFGSSWLKELWAARVEVLADAAFAGVKMEVPAADRLVSLDHNQIADTDRSVSDIIDVLEADNGDPDNPGLRELILGQLKAGRELIKAGKFSAYLLYVTLVRGLGELISKYKNPIIVSMANALLGAIVSQILQAK